MNNHITLELNKEIESLLQTKTKLFNIHEKELNHYVQLIESVILKNFSNDEQRQHVKVSVVFDSYVYRSLSKFGSIKIKLAPINANTFSCFCEATIGIINNPETTVQEYLFHENISFPSGDYIGEQEREYYNLKIAAINSLLNFINELLGDFDKYFKIFTHLSSSYNDFSCIESEYYKKKNERDNMITNSKKELMSLFFSPIDAKKSDEILKEIKNKNKNTNNTGSYLEFIRIEKSKHQYTFKPVNIFIQIYNGAMSLYFNGGGSKLTQKQVKNLLTSSFLFKGQLIKSMTEMPITFSENDKEMCISIDDLYKQLKPYISLHSF